MKSRTARTATQWRPVIVGGGMVGSIFGRLLSESGEPVHQVVSRSVASARKASRFMHAKGWTTDIRQVDPSTRLILLTTPHAAVRPVAEALAALPGLQFSRLFVGHASGMLTADALAPLTARGACAFSFHPLQSFPRNFRPGQLLDSARGITYGVDGSPRAMVMARKLARRLGGTVWSVPPEMRVFYHAASVVASTHVAALASILETMFAAINVSSPTRTKNNFYAVYEPLIRSTLNLVANESPQEALGGAIARGGIDTLSEHTKAVVENTPALVFPFAALCAQAITLAEHRGALTPNQIDGMRDAVASVCRIDRSLSSA